MSRPFPQLRPLLSGCKLSPHVFAMTDNVGSWQELEETSDTL